MWHQTQSNEFGPKFDYHPAGGQGVQSQYWRQEAVCT